MYKLLKKSGKIFGRIQENDFQFSEDKGEQLKKEGYVDKTIKLGVRPEHIHLTESIKEKQEHHIVMEAEIMLVEFLGAETYLHLKLKEYNVIAKIAVNIDLKVGDKVKISIDNRYTHTFNNETQKLIF